jgi:hypothetical protein
VRVKLLIEKQDMQVTTLIKQHSKQLIILHRIQASCVRLRNMESSSGAVIAATY